jgi:hypothetical protein
MIAFLLTTDETESKTRLLCSLRCLLLLRLIVTSSEVNFIERSVQ